MGEVTRRGLLRAGAGIAAGTALAGGPLQGFVALAEGAPRQRPDHRALGPVPDRRDGKVRLHLPAGFEYRSFHDTEAPVTLDDGTALPGRHDGMAAFQGRRGNVVLVRNHEVNGPVAAAFGPGTPYDAHTGGGTTTVEVTRFGEVVRSFTSLNGTQMNCSGGRMPWGSWITCEETVNGPDVGADFTGASNVTLQRPHGWLFEVPASADPTFGQSTRTPIRSAGRFAHEAVAYDPHQNHLYLTEDSFGFQAGFYRYIPPSNPMRTGRLEDGGQLQMLAVKGVDNADLAASQSPHAVLRVRWVDIAEPDPEFAYTPGQPAPTANDDAIQYVSSQGLEQGAAGFSRLEGCVYSRGVVYFCSTQGGGPQEPGESDTVQGWGNGSGQIWAYHTRLDVLRLVYESPGPDTLDFPDNITTRQGGTLVLCEDNTNDNYLRGLTPLGQLSDIALNRLTSSTGTDRSGDEFAGATFSPDGHTLFVNIQASRGMTFAIWGPWGRIGVH
jgi:secreted PhoX family phosphatase